MYFVCIVQGSSWTAWHFSFAPFETCRSFCSMRHLPCSGFQPRMQWACMQHCRGPSHPGAAFPPKTGNKVRALKGAARGCPIAKLRSKPPASPPNTFTSPMMMSTAVVARFLPALA